MPQTALPVHLALRKYLKTILNFDGSIGHFGKSSAFSFTKSCARTAGRILSMR